MSHWLLALSLGCGGIATSKDSAVPLDATDTASDDVPDEVDPLSEVDPAQFLAGANPCRGPVYVSVDEVVDGDTVRVTSGRGVESVRLIGIDASEVDHDGDWDECWAEEAREYLVDLIQGNGVWLTFDSECEDDYDRTLAYVHTRPGDEGFLQRNLILGGWVTTFAVSPNTTYADQFTQDESDARAAGAGLWGACSR